MRKVILAAVAVTLLGGCAARSTTKMARGEVRQAAHSSPVCMLKSPLPTNISYKVIGDVRGGKRWYGSMNEVLPVMADEARGIGADAIINLKTGFDMNAWAWARPVANGTGVKLDNKADLDCLKLGGELR